MLERRKERRDKPYTLPGIAPAGEAAERIMQQFDLYDEERQSVVSEEQPAILGGDGPYFRGDRVNTQRDDV